MYVASYETEVKVLRKLEELEQSKGKIPDFVQIYRQLLKLQGAARSRFTGVRLALSEGDISARLTEGIPLLSFQDLALDWAQVRDFCQEIIDVVEPYLDAQEEVETLGNVCSDASPLEKVARLWYEGSSLIAMASEYKVNGESLYLVVAATLKPFLSTYAELLLPKVDQESWRRRYCPICGGAPDFGYLDKERGSRWLLCSRCDAEWLFQRLECPYCGSQDQNSLAYFTDDAGLYRLYVCEQCKRYLKAIDLRQTEPEILLPLERLLTFELDIRARKNGYSPCAEANINERSEEGVSWQQ